MPQQHTGHRSEGDPSFTRASSEKALHVLAFDTSTEQLCVGLHTPQGSFTKLAEGGAAASAALVPQVHALLREAGVTLAELTHVAFGRGPGAFTGLRTACAVAQGLAFGLQLPVLPIDSLLIVAEDAREPLALSEGEALAVAMDARMDEAYAARYAWHAGAWEVLDAPALYTLPALAERWQAVDVAAVAGSAVTAFAARLPLPARCRGAEQDRAGALLRLAVRAARAGQGVDAAEALPLYLRDKVAQTTAEREAAKALASGAQAAKVQA